MKQVVSMRIVVCLMALLIFSCSKKSVTTTANTNPSNTNNTQNEVLETVLINNPTGTTPLKAILFIPASSTSLPAVIVQHGSGGLWSSNDATNTQLASQFHIWIDSFRVNKIAALFIDSYTPRGVKNFPNMAPPENIFLAAEFVRPRDAYAGLNYLRTLTRIKSNKIALLGFSHGGTSVLSTMVDAQAVSKTTWSLISGGVTYTDGVLPPAQRPSEGGFVAAVSYYPGAAMFSYYGRPGTPSNGKYIPYAPVMIHAAGKDPLYTTLYTNSDNNTNISAYDGLILKAQQSPLSAPMTMHVYPDADHSFDGVTGNNEDAKANLLAKKRTLDFLKSYLLN
ncbi:dienelactone hydrolase family protein [Sediminibacterium sp. KACHI17]